MTLMVLLLPVLLGLMVAIGLSAVYSGSETAALTVNEPRLRARAERGHNRARRALQLLRDRQRVIAIVLVGTNLANVMATLLAERAFGLVGTQFGINPLYFTIINFLVITPTLLILGEIVPKHYCRIKSNLVLPLLVGFLRLSGVVFLPLLNICTFFTAILLKPFGVKAGQTAYRRELSVDDIKDMVGRGGASGHIERNEEEMISRIFDLRDTIVREIMCPMVDIVALDKADLTLDCIKEQARETGHSRFPVYEEKIFNMVGYVDIYDVLQRSADIEDVVDLVREPYFVPETLKISDLLTAFLKNRLPAAIVLDEHGGAVGWVTREDVLEEVVGEIEDEFDPADVNEIEVVDAITLVAKASIDIDDLNRRFNLPLPLDEEFDTLGGLVFTRLGRVPEVGDCIKESVLELTVEEMEGVKITRVRVRVLDAAPVDDEIMDDTSEDDLGMERPPRIPSFFDQQSEPNLSTPPSNT